MYARVRVLLLALLASWFMASGAAVAQQSASLQVSAARPGLLWLTVEGRSFDNVSDPSKSNGAVTATVISDGSLDLSVRTNYPWWLTIAMGGSVSHLFGPDTQLHWTRVRSSLLPVVPAGEEVHISLEWVREEAPGDKARAVRPAPPSMAATTSGATTTGASTARGSAISTSGASGSSTSASRASTDESAPKRPATEPSAAEPVGKAGKSGRQSGEGVVARSGATKGQANGAPGVDSTENSNGNSSDAPLVDSSGNSKGRR